MYYNYVVCFMFDEPSSSKIQKMKNFLKENNIETKEKPWPPHITLDLYENIDKTTLIDKTSEITNNLSSFKVNLNEINQFGDSVLYLQPEDTTILKKIKKQFDKTLEDYRIAEIIERELYTPHVTLLINQNVANAKNILNNIFEPFEVNVTNIAIYNKNLELIHNFTLKEKNNDLEY